MTGTRSRVYAAADALILAKNWIALSNLSIAIQFLAWHDKSRKRARENKERKTERERETRE